MSQQLKTEPSCGTRKRTGLPIRTSRLAAVNDVCNIPNNIGPRMNRINEDGRDSGLSSESSTPTGGSPSRQPKLPTQTFILSKVASMSHSKSDYERIASGRTSRLMRSRSGTESPKSLDNVRVRQVGSPLRTPRSTQSPSLDSGDEASLRIERGTYQHMFQDIVSIKTMLLKLKRVVQEPGENSLTRAETLNPFDNSTKNGLFFNLNEGDTTNLDNLIVGENKTTADELVDLRRQVVFLQGQLQDRDRTIQTLQLQLSKLGTSKTNENHNYLSSNNFDNIITSNTCNAATQTEKTRPVSSGPSLLQSLPQDSNMGSLVSWSDIRNHKNLSGIEPKKNQHNLHNGHVDTSAIIIESEKNIDLNDTRQEDTIIDENFLKKSYIPNVRHLIKATTLKKLENNVSIIDEKYSA